MYEINMIIAETNEDVSVYIDDLIETETLPSDFEAIPIVDINEIVNMIFGD